VADNYSAAIDVAMLFQALGEHERANRLFERSLALMRSLPSDYVKEYGIFKARIHAMRGEEEEALAALREAINSGWTFQWWFHLKQDPAFDRSAMTRGSRPWSK
jgi:tetratricopeptide (TPR) repeat protein